MSPLSRVNDPGRLRALVAAVLAVGSDLSLPHVLRTIVETAQDVIGARYAALGVLSARGDELAEFVHVGIPAGLVTQIGPLPQGHGLLGLIITDPRPVRVADLGRHPLSYGFPAHHPPMGSFLGVPILVRGEVFGNLYVTDKLVAPEFTEEDEGLAVGLAAAAGIAIENARLHARVRDLTLIEDRERIAADLHDTVIQRLFATGLGLQASLKVISPRQAAARVEAAVGELDDTIRQIRSTIFALHTPLVAGRGLRAEILSLAAEAAASLRFEPHLRIDGPVDAQVDAETAHSLLAVLREALSNVVRHAGADRVDVAVEVVGGRLRAEVRDNGPGPGPGGRVGGRGLTNLRQRAEHLGGTMTFGHGPGGAGTILSWEVPLNGSPGRPEQ